jgi:hypothetical protein
VSASFTLDNTFKHTLFDMMQQLKYALQGGDTVENQENEQLEVIEEQQPEVVENEFSENN